jgi:hypothetical protein
MARKKTLFELRPFDNESFAATVERWQGKTNMGFPADIEMSLSWADAHRDYASPSGDFSYGIFGSNSEGAAAITTLVYRKDGRRWLKMLDLRLSPELDASLNDGGEYLSEIASIFTEAIAGTLRLTAVHKSDTVKLYARSSGLLSFFKGLTAHLQSANSADKLTTTIEGRWMVFRSK